MHAIQTILSRPEVERLGWLLVHFVWQGAAVAAILATLLLALRRASANVRYLTACAALALMTACPIVTWQFLPAFSRVAEAPRDVEATTLAVATLPIAVSLLPADARPSVTGVIRDSRGESAGGAATTVRTTPNERSFDGRSWIKRWLPWGVAAWLTGVVAMSLRLLLGLRTVQSLRRSVVRPADPEQQAVLARLAKLLKVTWPVRLVESALVEVPTVIGWLRPVILLPVATLAGLSPEQFESLMAHELAHVRRHDYLMNLVQTMIETILFYHPGVWWVSSWIRQERENCCDDWAIRICGNRISYARALVRLEEQRSARPGLALASSGARLLPRIRRIVGAPEMPRGRTGYWLAGATVLVALVASLTAIGISISTAADDPTKVQGVEDPETAKRIDKEKTTTQADPKPQLPATIEVSGTVVDDETGEPVAKFDTQGGHVDDKDPTKIRWGYWLSPNAGDAEGHFNASLGWSDGWRLRIVAGGYVSEPIFSTPPQNGATKVTDHVVRLKHGKSVAGHVLDYQGKPVPGASLFLVGKRPVSITQGKAMSNGAYGWGEDKSIVHYTANADGKYKVPGIGGDDPQKIAVSCPTLDLWVVPITSDTPLDDFTILLPEPGKLRLDYNVPGGPDEAQVFLQMHTFEMPGWEAVENIRYPTIKRGGELTLDNMPPGLYEVVRQKQLSGEGFDTAGFLDRRQVTIESGKTANTGFVRATGAPITGVVVGLDREDIAKAKPTGVVVSVDLPQDRDLPPKFDELLLRPTTQGVIDGRFKTETIPPGEYVVHVHVFISETEEQRQQTGIVPAGYTGEAKVTVPENGAPESVKIELKPWEFPKPGNAMPRRGNTGKAPANLSSDPAEPEKKAEPRVDNSQSKAAAAPPKLPAPSGLALDPNAPGPVVPQRVVLVQPLMREVADYQDFTGRTEAAETIELKARITGDLNKIAFRGGETVKQGDLLFEIDPRLYQAEWDKSAAEVQRAEARLKRADSDLNRAKALAGTGTLSAEELSRITGDRDDADAALRVARSAVEIAQLQLSFAKVTAPINGKIGQPSLAAGNLVNADATVLAKLDAIDPMHVKFDVDERTYLQWKASKRAKTAAGKEEAPTVLIQFADEKDWSHRGKVESIATRLDSDTGTIAFRAVISNAEGLYLPGMFARIRLSTGNTHVALLVPAEATAADQFSRYVLVLHDHNVAALRRVKFGGSFDGLVEVTEGLLKTDWIVKRPLGLHPDTVVVPEREEDAPENPSSATKPK